MINIQNELQFIIRESGSLLDRVQQTMVRLPSDDLYYQKKGSQQYYWDAAKSVDGKHPFLGKADDPEVSNRLKYQVCRILFHRLQHLIQALQEIIDTIPLTIDLNDLEKELPEKYRCFPRSLYQDLQMIDQQSLQVQTENTFHGYGKWLRHKTLSGLMVRSKSEQIIADRLYLSGIRFEYEAALPDENGPEIHPDFRLFYPTQNRWVYLEHIGRTDEPNYMESLKKKVGIYIDQGMLIGSDVYFTYDRPDGTLDLHILDALIAMILQKEQG